MTGWVKKSERHYFGTFAGVSARLVCCDTPGIPDQHNKWLIISDANEGAPVVGSHGDAIEDVLRRAATEMIISLQRALRALRANGTYALTADGLHVVSR